MRWTDIYARAGVTAAELVDIVSERGGGGIRRSKMCISLLRESSSLSSSTSPVGVDSGRRRLAGGGNGGGGVAMFEALQIAGPEGVFEEWKVRFVVLRAFGLILAGVAVNC